MGEGWDTVKEKVQDPELASQVKEKAASFWERTSQVTSNLIQDITSDGERKPYPTSHGYGGGNLGNGYGNGSMGSGSGGGNVGGFDKFGRNNSSNETDGKMQTNSIGKNNNSLSSTTTLHSVSTSSNSLNSMNHSNKNSSTSINQI